MPTPDAPASRPPAAILAELESRKAQWRWPVMVAGLLWELVDAGGEVPEDFRGKMPPRPELEPEAAKELPRPAIPTAPPPATTVDLIAALIRPGATDDQAKLAARKLAEDLDDLHSVNAHRRTMAEVRAGTMPLKTVMAAYRASKGHGVEHRARIFMAFIGGARDERDLRNRAGRVTVRSTPAGPS